MNSDIDHWEMVKSKIIRQWSRISNVELERTRGNISAISNLILKKHDVSKKDIAKALVDIMHTSINEDIGGENDYQEHSTHEEKHL